MDFDKIYQEVIELVAISGKPSSVALDRFHSHDWAISIRESFECDVKFECQTCGFWFFYCTEDKRVNASWFKYTCQELTIKDIIT